MSDADKTAAAGQPEVLQAQHFAPHVGKVFQFKGTPHAFPLDHIVESDLPIPSWMQRRPFTLIFRGPKERAVLPEGLYEAEVEGGPCFTLYVAPIHTPSPDRQDYQAVFN